MRWLIYSCYVQPALPHTTRHSRRGTISCYHKNLFYSDSRYRFNNYGSLPTTRSHHGQRSFDFGKMAGIRCRLRQDLSARPWAYSGDQIVFVSIMGFVLSAAALEWFLWLAAFLYCLVKVFKKAEHWTIRLLAVIMMISFTALRSVTQSQSARTLLISLQMHLFASHGCHATTASTNHSQISS